MSARGLFITVEGGEGVGKSTNMAFIEENLRNHGVDLAVDGKRLAVYFANNIEYFAFRAGIGSDSAVQGAPPASASIAGSLNPAAAMSCCAATAESVSSINATRACS